MLLSELAGLIDPEDASPVDAARIAAFEAEVGFQLPSALKSLLTTSGAGNLNQSVMAAWGDLHHEGRNALTIAQLFGLDREAWRSIRPLSLHIEEMGYRCDGVPAGIFCFGDDWCGNVVTVDLREASYGTIARVDHETVGDRFEDPETYEIAATSFDDFIEMLTPSPEDEDDWWDRFLGTTNKQKLQ